MKLQEGQRVSVGPAADGWKFASVHGGGKVALVGQNGTVVDVSENLAHVEIDDGPVIVVGRVNDPRIKPINQVILDLSGWTRLAEVDEFAVARNVDRANAIRMLVERSLCTLRPDPTS